MVARMFNVSRAMLFRWQQKYDQGGPVALETKKTPGPASRLSPTQLSKLYAIITGSDPRQLEFDFGLWTRKIIRELIRREFGVKLSEVQVGRLLNKIGLSPQRPLYRAYQQDPERVAEWKKSAYPKIRKLAAEEGASIFFADEASIRTDHHAGTTWAPVGQTPVVITTGERKSVNMVSAISPRGELRFRVQEGTMNAGKFIDFLKALLDSVPGKIFLIVDGHPVHKAKKVSEFVKEKADGRLSIFFLPPYSPDLNPDEWVWNNVKNDRIGRSVIMSADDLKAKAIGALRRLQKLPGIVRGFLRDPKLAYILELHSGTAHGVYKGISSLVIEPCLELEQVDVLPPSAERPFHLGHESCVCVPCRPQLEHLLECHHPGVRVQADVAERAVLPRPHLQLAGARCLPHIDTRFGEPSHMFFALLGVNDMVGPIPLVETICDEWLEYPALLVNAVKERADMATLDGGISGELRRLQGGRHNPTFAVTDNSAYLRGGVSLTRPPSCNWLTVSQCRIRLPVPRLRQPVPRLGFLTSPSGITIRSRNHPADRHAGTSSRQSPALRHIEPAGPDGQPRRPGAGHWTAEQDGTGRQ